MGHLNRECLETKAFKSFLESQLWLFLSFYHRSWDQNRKKSYFPWILLPLFFFLLRVLSSKMGKELQYHSTSNWENYKVQLMLWNSHVGGKKFTAQIFILLSFIFFFLSHRYIDANSCKLDISLIACKLLTPWGTVEPPLWLQQSSKQVRNFLFVAVSSIEELKNNTGERGKRQGTCDAFHLHSSHCIIYTNLKNLNK